MKKLLYVLLFIPLALFGQENYSLIFDGQNDYVDIVNDENFNIQNQLTLSGWFRTSHLTDQKIITNSGNYYFLMIDDGVDSNSDEYRHLKFNINCIYELESVAIIILPESLRKLCI